MATETKGSGVLLVYFTKACTSGQRGGTVPCFLKRHLEKKPSEALTRIYGFAEGHYNIM